MESKTSHSTGLDDITAEPEESLWKLLAPSLAFAGVQASWAVQTGHGSAFLRKLGLRNELVGLAWLAGPVTGAVVQPIVGSLSDSCTSRFGKRKPFMLAGALGMCAGMFLFSNSANLAKLVGDPVAESGEGSKTGLAIAIVSFWIIDAFTNTLQGPARTLLGDLAPTSRLSDGNAYMAAANGCGKVIGYASGSFSTRIEVVYGVTAVIALVLTLISLSVDTSQSTTGHSAGTPEIPIERDASEKQKHPFACFGDMPRPVAKAFVVQSLSYFVFMLLFVYGSVWAGRDVFQGAGDAPVTSTRRKQFDAGVQAANQGFLLMAVCSIALSLSLPKFLRIFGFRPCWSLGLCTLGVSMMMTKVVKSAIGLYMVFAAFSLPIACSFTIPWTVVAVSLRRNATVRGTQMAVFNLSQSVPCIVAVLVGSLMLKIWGETIDNVLCMGGVVAMMASALVWWCDDPNDAEDEEEYVM